MSKKIEHKLVSPTEPCVVPVLNIRDAARYIGICEWSLRQLVYARKIAFIQLGRKYVFKPADLDAYLEAHRVEPRRRAA